jgi:predicted dehydrogenase
MEGMWARFFPATVKTFELINSGAIGEIKYMRADFGFAAPFNPDGRVFNLKLGGGAQLDVGVYPMFLTLLFLGKPDKVQASVHRGSTGADETTAVQLSYADGKSAHFVSSIVAFTPQQADIIGTTGIITMHSPAHKSQLITITRKDSAGERFDFPFSGLGFEYEVAHVTECLQKNLKESPLMPLSLSLTMAETADEILRQGNVVYPTGIN